MAANRNGRRWTPPELRVSEPHGDMTVMRSHDMKGCELKGSLADHWRLRMSPQSIRSVIGAGGHAARFALVPEL